MSATCGDICPNPGPISGGNGKPKCPVCHKTVARNHRAVSCDLCHLWCHIKCGGIKSNQYKHLQLSNDFSWTCPECLLTLNSLSFADVSNIESDLDVSHSNLSTDSSSDGLTDFQVLDNYQENFKIAHLNINSIAGFKFQEVKLWLSRHMFDVLVLTETKLDHTLLDSQFHIEGYRFMRKDRNIHGGGIMLYWRSDLTFHNLQSSCDRLTDKVE